MRRAFVPILAVSGAIFLTAPIIIARAPFESTMGLVQKIFYFHMPPAMLMLLSAIFCGLVSGAYLATRRPVLDWTAYAAAELTVDAKARPQLQVTARYSDGMRRDVTCWARFLSNQDNVAKVDDEGQVTVVGTGEAILRAHFGGQVAVWDFTLHAMGKLAVGAVEQTIKVSGTTTDNTTGAVARPVRRALRQRARGDRCVHRPQVALHARPRPRRHRPRRRRWGATGAGTGGPDDAAAGRAGPRAGAAGRVELDLGQARAARRG